MANPEHLKILKQGVVAWNKWRVDNPEITPDLRGADLSGANLREVYLEGANMTGARLVEANLIEADFGAAQLDGAVFLKANLSGAYLARASLTRGCFSEVRLPYPEEVTVLGAAKLREAKLNGADLKWAELGAVDLSRANLEESNLCRSHLGGADLSGANLRFSNLTEAYLNNSDLGEALVGYTIFGDNDLSAVKGLETLGHWGPSTIGVDTIFKSKGNIPEVFLRGAGVPEEFIVYMRSLTANPIDFYSCFISYSSKDDAFAQRLHADLQQKGVRCWFAPEELKIGDEFRTRIDESIRVYDKLMVILSANSIGSRWVKEEVEAAFEKEDKQKKLALFPIRLDDAVMENDQAWAVGLRRTRHIGDFRAWKDHDPYQKSFDRLMRDLKA